MIPILKNYFKRNESHLKKYDNFGECQHSVYLAELNNTCWCSADKHKVRFGHQKMIVHQLRLIMLLFME